VRRVRPLGGVARIALVASIAAFVAPACSLGNGTGSCSGTLDVPDCWAGPFDLHPSFFAAVPSPDDDSLQIRIQNGGDYETFSDGLAILVDDAGEVRGDPASDGTPRPSLLGMTLIVALPSGVTPPGVPISPRARSSIVHATLYLDATCRTQDDALYALDAVTTNADGTCLAADGAAPSITCPDSASTGSPAAASPGTVGTSTIVFNALFDGNSDESNAAERLSDGYFHLFLADPREICPGGVGPPPPCRGELTGNFHFYFERGRPAQPFP
jgi:hypothetical protein